MKYVGYPLLTRKWFQNMSFPWREIQLEFPTNEINLKFCLQGKVKKNKAGAKGAGERQRTKSVRSLSEGL